MAHDFSEQRILNWARDFLTKETYEKGFCKEEDFKETFNRFKAAYGYKKNYKDLLRILKKDGYIDRMTKEIRWEII